MNLLFIGASARAQSTRRTKGKVPAAAGDGMNDRCARAGPVLYHIRTNTIKEERSMSDTEAITVVMDRMRGGHRVGYEAALNAA